MALSPIRLVAGLGNPGPKYEATRHNVGFWWVDRVARQAHCALRPDRRVPAELGTASLDGADCHLMKPTTYMNRSGQAVGPYARYHRLEPAQVLVVHDDLDLPPGTVRLKQGGGHGGHNGLRSVIEHLGSRDFVRLRIGIGHPGERDAVLGYVLGRPAPDERIELDRALDRALEALPWLLEGALEKAMQFLHTPR